MLNRISLIRSSLPEHFLGEELKQQNEKLNKIISELEANDELVDLANSALDDMEEKMVSEKE